MLQATGIILCGGKSTRMGFDKIMIPYKKTFLIEYLIQEFHKIFTHVALVTTHKERLEKINIMNSEIYEDIYLEKGPLGGIYTALYHSQNSYNFIMPCDMPIVDTYLINLLYSYKKTYDIVIPQKNGFLEALYGFYDKNIQSLIQKNLIENTLAIRRSIMQSKSKIIPIDHLEVQSDIFVNFNYPHDLFTFTSLDKKKGKNY